MDYEVIIFAGMWLAVLGILSYLDYKDCKRGTWLGPTKTKYHVTKKDLFYFTKKGN